MREQQPSSRKRPPQQQPQEQLQKHQRQLRLPQPHGGAADDVDEEKKDVSIPASPPSAWPSNHVSVPTNTTVPSAAYLPPHLVPHSHHPQHPPQPQASVNHHHLYYDTAASPTAAALPSQWGSAHHHHHQPHYHLPQSALGNDLDCKEPPTVPASARPLGAHHHLPYPTDHGGYRISATPPLHPDCSSPNFLSGSPYLPYLDDWSEAGAVHSPDSFMPFNDSPFDLYAAKDELDAKEAPSVLSEMHPTVQSTSSSSSHPSHSSSPATSVSLFSSLPTPTSAPTSTARGKTPKTKKVKFEAAPPAARPAPLPAAGCTFELYRYDQGNHKNLRAVSRDPSTHRYVVVVLDVLQLNLRSAAFVATRRFQRHAQPPQPQPQPQSPPQSGHSALYTATTRNEEMQWSPQQDEKEEWKRDKSAGDDERKHWSTAEEEQAEEWYEQQERLVRQSHGGQDGDTFILREPSVRVSVTMEEEETERNIARGHAGYRVGAQGEVGYTPHCMSARQKQSATAAGLACRERQMFNVNTVDAPQHIRLRHAVRLTRAGHTYNVHSKEGTDGKKKAEWRQDLPLTLLFVTGLWHLVDSNKMHTHRITLTVTVVGRCADTGEQLEATWEVHIVLGKHKRH